MPYLGPKEYLQLANSIAEAALDGNIRKELVAQGFPGYMTYSFIETAKSTQSIVLSRLPGGAGTDLIEEGYDLKGFHIKAKSCNWGPMAGFICQLPVFNKLGIDKASYNTNEIGHYLKSLDHFDAAKKRIEGLELTRKFKLAHIPESVTDKVAAAAEINDEINKEILGILTVARKAEQKTGHWSGENMIKGLSPFIPLRRKFKDVEEVLKMRGVKKAIAIGPDYIYGIAQNVTDEEDETKSRPTIITEFLLERKKDGIWDIYHGRIKYKNLETDPKFNKDFTGAVIADKIHIDVKTKYADFLAQIFEFCKTEPIEVTNKEQLKLMKSSFELDTDIFPEREDKLSFFKVRGFMNPFPPFPEDGTNSYKNAVSGDYDLFAIWPSVKVDQDELLRESELTTTQLNRLGGKIFTTYFGNRSKFAIEFVPGFSELNPKKDNPTDLFKESADFGNMHSLGHLVSGFLNSFAATFLSQQAGIVSNANKGFHSDEGGRPGIMEVEFPIAVFLPEKISSKALNNVSTGGKIPVIAARTGIKTQGGLIKTPEELVIFILECMKLDYRVYMHYRWMIHLLYNTIPAGDVKKTFEKVFSPDVLKRIKTYKKDFVVNAETYKEFTAIDKNNDIIKGRIDPDLDTYTENLKEILLCKGDASGLFEELRMLFLSYAFLSEVPSFEKKIEVETSINALRIKPVKPVEPVKPSV